MNTDCALMDVIPTTHWDPAWYWPRERFRVKLIQMWQAVIELWEQDPDYTFNADGQWYCVKEYLDIFPEHRSLFAKRGSEGRLQCAGLFCQSDLYCTGGEALIRNMLIGKAESESINAWQAVMYLPDTFGHTPSLPMLCHGFGLELLVFMRGVPGDIDPDNRFWKWACPDGSEINVFRLRDGYANAAGLGLHQGSGEIMDKGSSGIRPQFNMDMAIQKIQHAAHKQIDAMGPPYHLNAGVDHQIPQRELPEIMCTAAEDHVHYRFSSWPQIIEQIQQKDHSQWQTHVGENHGSGAATILGGTVSTRVYLKQQNARCEQILTDVIEPADAIVACLHKSDPCGKMLTHTWTNLLHNHPHDNITGCSVDSVHRQDEAIYEQVLQAADGMQRQLGEGLIHIYGGQQADDIRYAFALFHADCQDSHKIVDISLDHEGRASFGDMPLHAAYDIVNEDGDVIPFIELSRERGVEHPHPVLQLRIACTLKAMRLHRFFLLEREHFPTAFTGRSLENEHLYIHIEDNGSATLTDKQSGVVHKQLGLFSDQADCGDEYDFSHIADESEQVFDHLDIKNMNSAGYNGYQSVTIEAALKIPEKLHDGRRSKDVMHMPLQITWSLGPESRHLDVKIETRNQSSDHRLRFNLCTKEPIPHSLAGLKFNSIERLAGERHEIKNGERSNIIDPIHPTDHFVAIPDQQRHLQISSLFPCNYEFINSGTQKRLAITLARSVGMLSQASLTRGPGAGPDTPTPEAQMLGRSLSWHFAIHSLASADDCFHESISWRKKPLYTQIMNFYTPLSDQQQTPLFQIDDQRIHISALKLNQSRDHLILRLFNPSITAIDCHLMSNLDWSPSALHEGPAEDDRINIDGRTVNLHFPPQSLITLRTAIT